MTTETPVRNTCAVCHKPLAEGEIGKTCKAHEGRIRKYAKTATAVPEGFIGMAVVCRALEAKGIKTSQIVNAAGGDACADPLLDPVFEVTYVGSRKFMHPDVLTKGLEILKNPPVKAQVVKAAKAPAATSVSEALKSTVVTSK